MFPHLRYEKKLWKKGIRFVAGIDEAGRGPLAGPVVAAAVILLLDFDIKGIDDSKKLSPQKRSFLFKQIIRKAIGIGIGIINQKTIDKINIHKATLRAMREAVRNLETKPDFLLIDGKRNRLPFKIPQKCICGGDGISVSIAAASIVAKVTRDKIMLKFHRKYPEYGFIRHKGYGTPEHFRKLKKLGPCPLHRRSFAPLAP